MFRDDSKDRGIITVQQLIESGLSYGISLDAVAHEVARRQANPSTLASNIDAEALFESHRSFFKEYFNLVPDFSKIVIPQLTLDIQSYTRIILMPEELARDEGRGFHNRLFNVCKELFPAWRSYNDLDKEVIYNDRHPKDGSYAIRVRDLIEADEEFANLSAEQIRKMQRKTETLAERLMHELKVWHESKQHLDTKNITLCAGSRSSGGYLPVAYWNDDELYVDWFFPQLASPVLRARSAVS